MGNNSDAHNKIRDKAFDFKNIPATTGIYQIHPYPAMFHYMLVRKVISEYSREGDYVIDPFMGSGVAGTESLLLNRNFFGCDINPLAAEIARVRTTPLETKQVKDIFALLHNVYKNAKEGYVPQVKNLRYWFDEVTIQNLSRLHTAISQVGDKDIARFFWIAFSEVVRETSLADKNEFKLVRRKTQASCDVWEVFEKIVHKNIEAIRTLDICKESQAQISIVEGNVFDVLKTLPHEGLICLSLHHRMVILKPLSHMVSSLVCLYGG